MVKPPTNQWKGNSYHEALQSTNDSNNKIDNTSDSNVNSNVSDSLEFLNSPTSPRQLTTLLLTTKHCDSEIVALKEQVDKSLEELGNPFINNESLLSERNDQQNSLKKTIKIKLKSSKS